MRYEELVSLIDNEIALHGRENAAYWAKREVSLRIAEELLYPYAAQPLIDKDKWEVFYASIELGAMQEMIWHQLEDEADGGVIFEDNLIELHRTAEKIILYLVEHHGEMDPAFRREYSLKTLQTLFGDSVIARHEICLDGLDRVMEDVRCFLELIPRANYWLRQAILGPVFAPVFDRKFSRAMGVVTYRLSSPGSS